MLYFCRYYAIHDPINYAQKRTVRRVLLMISILWVVSMLISVPPLLGWNNSNGRNLYNQVSILWVMSMLILVPPLLGWNNSNGCNLHNQVHDYNGNYNMWLCGTVGLFVSLVILRSFLILAHHL